MNINEDSEVVKQQIKPDASLKAKNVQKKAIKKISV